MGPFSPVVPQTAVLLLALLTSSALARPLGNVFSSQTTNLYSWVTSEESSISTPKNTNIAFSSVAASETHGCGISETTKQLYCWQQQVFQPTLVPSNRKYSKVAVHTHGTCAIEEQTGNVYCFDADAQNSKPLCSMYDETPTGRKFDDLACGTYHCCGIERETMKAFCWGDGRNGELGDGYYYDAESARIDLPVEVFGEHKWSSIFANPSARATCGIEHKTGAAYCWGGFNSPSGFAQERSPVLFGIGVKWLSLAPSAYKICGIESGSHRLLCIGYTSCLFGLSNNKRAFAWSPNPVDVAPHQTFKEFSVGRNHMCAVDTESNMHCCGAHMYEEVDGGDMQPTDKLTPVQSHMGWASVVSAPSTVFGLAWPKHGWA